MKVAFWSNSPGKSGVTANMCCITILSAILRSSEMVLFENHSSINNLGNAFLNQTSYDKLQEKHSYFVETGLGRILNYCSKMYPEESMDADVFYHTCVPLFDNRIFYLPVGGMNQDLIEYRLRHHVEDVMQLLERFCGTVCVDISSAPLESSRKFLQECDLVVVNLCQNNQVLSHLFRNFSQIRKKAFFVIGKYDSKSILTKHEIVKKYSLPPNRVGTIPYNRTFADALTQGEVVSFLLRATSCGMDHSNYEFMQAAKETVLLFEQARGDLYMPYKHVDKEGENVDVENERDKNTIVYPVCSNRCLV